MTWEDHRKGQPAPRKREPIRPWMPRPQRTARKSVQGRERPQPAAVVLLPFESGLCAFCGVWPTPERADAEYCSDRCRVRAYRRRKANQ
jgi:hypothetical protein